MPPAEDDAEVLGIPGEEHLWSGQRVNSEKMDTGSYLTLILHLSGTDSMSMGPWFICE